MSTETFPPVPLAASDEALKAVSAGITDFAVEDASHSCGRVWLRAADHSIWQVVVCGVDLRHMFEVFALGLEPHGREVAASWRGFSSESGSVLRRSEFIVPGDDDVPRFGGPPHLAQSAAMPGAEPADAVAACEVCVGLHFGSEHGEELLIAADRFPFKLLVSQDRAEIADFLQSCARDPIVASSAN